MTEQVLTDITIATLQHVQVEARKAFNRIYQIATKGKEAASSTDIQELQERVFRKGIARVELHSILGSTAITHEADSTTFSVPALAFEDALLKLIKRGRAETVWAILRYYGYDTQLKVRRSFTHPKLPQHSDSELAEISQNGVDFFTELWETADEVSYLELVSRDSLLARCNLLTEMSFLAYSISTTIKAYAGM